MARVVKSLLFGMLFFLSEAFFSIEIKPECWHGNWPEIGDVPSVRHPFSAAFESAKLQNTLVPVLVIGSGPSGLAAALYTARAKMHTVVVMGNEPLGQLSHSPRVENIPAVSAAQGQTIMDFMEQCAAHAGVKFLDDTVVKIERAEQESFFIATTASGYVLHALTVIIATGVSPRAMGIVGEDTYTHRGVFNCAIYECRQTTGKAVVVAGNGGVWAFSEMISYLLPYAQSITVVGAADTITAAAHKQRQNSEKLTLYPNGKLIEIYGDGRAVTGVRVQTEKGEIRELPTEFVFLALSRAPNSELFASLVTRDAQGYIDLTGRSQATSCLGVFAAGNVADRLYKQASTATGYGAAAGLDAVAYLQRQGFSREVADLVQPYCFKPVRTKIMPRESCDFDPNFIHVAFL